MSIDATTNSSCITITIDPGHGVWKPSGHIDPGATKNRNLYNPRDQADQKGLPVQNDALIKRFHHKEIDYAMTISRSLKTFLSNRLGFRAHVFLTRSKTLNKTETKAQKLQSLKTRPQIANRAGADLFVSIHINSNRDSSKNGFSVHYTPGLKNQTESIRLAKSILNANRESHMFHDRKIHKQGLAVLRSFKGTAGVLVECGFISHLSSSQATGADDLVKLEIHPEAIARMIGKGVLDYIHQTPSMSCVSQPAIGDTDLLGLTR